MKIKKWSTLFGLIIALMGYTLLNAHGLPHPQAIAAAIALLTLLWWITEALPIPATSLVPLAAFPLFGIVSHKTIAYSLGNHVILLLMGAFMLSKAIEKSGIAKRLALYLLYIIGGQSGKRLVLGFMLAASFLSMWLSNTATTLMMLPIAMACIDNLDLLNNRNRQLQQALILGIAYAANVGGVGTLIGTPPNLIFAGIYEELTGNYFDFSAWLAIGLPIVMIALPFMAWWLTRGLEKTAPVELPRLDAWRQEEWRTLLIVGLTAIAWITRKEPFGGWSLAFNLPMVGDSTVVLVAVILLFATPNGKSGRLLDWEHAKTIPWDTLLLFAGGIALAKGMSASGLVTVLANKLAILTVLPTYAMLLSLCLIVTFLTEMTSNTAITTLLMPLLASVAMATKLPPSLLMIPAAISSSCAFMLPVATAPNAIAFGTGTLHISDMIKKGFILSLLLAFIIATVCYLQL